MKFEYRENSKIRSSIIGHKFSTGLSKFGHSIKFKVSHFKSKWIIIIKKKTKK